MDANTQQNPHPRKGAVKKTPSLLMPMAIGGLAIMMLGGIIFKSKASRGTCTYDSVYRKATCKVKGLSSIPKDISDSVLTIQMGHKLDKSENSFTVLEQGNFSRFQHLQELRLHKCGIQDVKPGAFSDLKSLQRLDLRYNRLQKVTEFMFQGLSNLESLYLSNNPIASLGDFTFRGVQLQNLILANNPALTEITSQAFSGASIRSIVLNRCSISTIPAEGLKAISDSILEFHLTNNLQPLKLPDNIFQNLRLNVLNLDGNGLTESDFLKYVVSEEISLDENPLEELDLEDCKSLSSTKRLSLGAAQIQHLDADDFQHLSQLEELDLEQNQLAVFNMTIFKELTNLRVLDVSRNSLQSIDGDATTSLISLKSLYLDDNKLQTIPEDIKPMFERLENITLHNNPFHCNCELRWLADWIGSNQGIISDIHALRCETPEQINFTQVSDDNFQCQPPIILNATFDSDGISLVCTAGGDPAPTVTWLGDEDHEIQSASPTHCRKEVQQTKCNLAISKNGNYTCMAVNRAGTDSVVIDTKNVPTSGLRFVVQSQEIEILETPQGFCIVLSLLCLLGYILRNS